MDSTYSRCPVCGLSYNSEKALQEHIISASDTPHFNFFNVVDRIYPKKNKSNEHPKKNKFNEHPRKKKFNHKQSKNIGATIRKSYMGSEYRSSSNHQGLGKHWVVEEYEDLKEKHKIISLSS